jgi:predicted phosphodiesterase
MRLALLSDIHGNPIALDAVLADIAAQGVDGYWILGDLCAVGYDPVTVLERLAVLPNALFVRGNTDRYTLDDTLPPPTFDQVRADPSLLTLLVEVAQGFTWTKGYLTGAGWLDWLDKLPAEQRLTLPDGTRMLAVHAAPHDDETVMHPFQTDDEIRKVISTCEADLYFFGHIHWPFDRVVQGVRVVNVGSVSNPPMMDLRASYVLLEADETGYTLDFRRVDYDHAAVIEAVQRARHPCAAYIQQFQKGKYAPTWYRK